MLNLIAEIRKNLAKTERNMRWLYFEMGVVAGLSLALLLLFLILKGLL